MKKARLCCMLLAAIILVLSVMMYIPDYVFAGEAAYPNLDDSVLYSINNHLDFRLDEPGVFDDVFIYDSVFQKWSMNRSPLVTFTDSELKDYLNDGHGEDFDIKSALSFVNPLNILGPLGIIACNESTIPSSFANYVAGLPDETLELYFETDGENLTITDLGVEQLRKQLEVLYYDSIGAYRLSPDCDQTPDNYLHINEDTISIYRKLGLYPDGLNEDAEIMKNTKYVITAYFVDTGLCDKYITCTNSLPYMALDPYCLQGSTSNKWYDYVRFYDNNLSEVNLFEYCPPLRSQFLSDGHCWTTMHNMRELYDKTITCDYSGCLATKIQFKDNDLQTGNYYYRKVFIFVRPEDMAYIPLFKSYSALYNYINGDQTAYMTSVMKNGFSSITDSLDNFRSMTADKMSEIVDAINNMDRNGMNPSDMDELLFKYMSELQGSIDNIESDTNESKNLLADLVRLMKDQNTVLEELLGVTKSIKGTVEYIAAVNTVDTINNITDRSHQFVNQAKTKFPISIPWDLMIVFEALAAPPEAPNFQLDYSSFMNIVTPIAVDAESPPENNYVIDIDLSNMQHLSDVSRTFLSLLFIYGLIRLTLRVIRK